MLSDTKVKHAKPKEKPYKISDSNGLFLMVTTTGSKYWRLKYYFDKKEKLLAFGIYPEITLAEARIKCAEARALLAKGIDPSLDKQIKKQARDTLVMNSFEFIAREWFAKFSPRWASSNSKKVLNRLEKNIFPWLGNRPITEISAPELLITLRRIENRGAIDTTHKCKQYCGQILRYAIATGRAKHDITWDLKGAIPPAKKNHYATITDPKSIADLIRTIKGYQGYFVTKCALSLAPLFFVRPGELRFAEWSEFNLENGEWRIPDYKMKRKVMHIVPLSKQAVNILQELQPLTGKSKFVFPSIRSLHQPISENTVLGALRRLGYTKDEITPHGFRSMASTVLNEKGWNPDAIERQLAHTEGNKVRAAYNHAQYLPERRKMMQFWADYLDELAT